MDPPHPPPDCPLDLSIQGPFLLIASNHFSRLSIPRIALWIATHPTISFIHTPSSNPNPSLQIFRAFNKLKKARGWTVVQRKRGGGNTEGEAGSEVNRAGDQGGERRRGGIRRVARKVEGNSFLELAIILIAFLNGTVRCCCSATRAATRASLPFVLTFLHPLLLPLSSV